MRADHSAESQVRAAELQVESISVSRVDLGNGIYSIQRQLGKRPWLAQAS